MTLPDKPTFTIPEVAKVIGISVSSAYAAARSDAFPFPVLKIGGRYVVPRKPLLNTLGITDDTPTAA